MMDMMVEKAKGKGTFESPTREGHAYQDSRRDPLHPLGFTPHHAQTIGAYISKMPSVGGYPYTYMPPLIG